MTTISGQARSVKAKEDRLKAQKGVRPTWSRHSVLCGVFRNPAEGKGRENDLTSLGS
jgi:hypothetical protein